MTDFFRVEGVQQRSVRTCGVQMGESVTRGQKRHLSMEEKKV